MVDGLVVDVRSGTWDTSISFLEFGTPPEVLRVSFAVLHIAVDVTYSSPRLLDIDFLVYTIP